MIFKLVIAIGILALCSNYLSVIQFECKLRLFYIKEKTSAITTNTDTRRSLLL